MENRKKKTIENNNQYCSMSADALDKFKHLNVKWSTLGESENPFVKPSLFIAFRVEFS